MKKTLKTVGLILLLMVLFVFGGLIYLLYENTKYMAEE